MNEAPFTCSTQEQASGLAHKYQNRLSMFAKDKHSSLLRESVNYGQKMFITQGPGCIGMSKILEFVAWGFTNIFCKSCLRPITSSFFKVELHNKVCTVRLAMLRNRSLKQGSLLDQSGKNFHNIYPSLKSKFLSFKKVISISITFGNQLYG